MSNRTEEKADARRDAYRAPTADDEAAPGGDAQLRRRGKLWVAAMIAAFILGVVAKVIG